MTTKRAVVLALVALLALAGTGFAQVSQTPAGANDLLNRSSAEFSGTVSADKIQADTYRSAVGASDAVLLSSSGIVSMPNQSAFYMYEASTGEVYTNGASVLASFSSTSFDNNGECTANTFTPKVSGGYVLQIGLDSNNAPNVSSGGYILVTLAEDGVGIARMAELRAEVANTHPVWLRGSILYKLTAGKAYTILFNNQIGADVVGESGGSWYFRGNRVF